MIQQNRAHNLVENKTQHCATVSTLIYTTIVSESTQLTCIALTSNSILTKTEFQTRSYQFRTAWVGPGTVKRASLDRILNRAIWKRKWRQAITDF